jgi:DNA mismatch endonuclease (patch repair protein)
MTDTVNTALRSRMMAGIRGKNTGPEMLVRKALHARGFRFRLHSKDLPGKPDLVLAKYHAAIFIHGCFWHGHDCPLFRLPGTRSEFWQKKIDETRTRDFRAIETLTSSGWRSFIIWECALRGSGTASLLRTFDTVCDWIRSGAATGQIRRPNHVRSRQIKFMPDMKQN